MKQEYVPQGNLIPARQMKASRHLGKDREMFPHEPISDDMLAKKVCEVLLSPLYATGGLEYGVSMGRVVLRGPVESEETRQELNAIISGIPGVVEIMDEMYIAREISDAPLKQQSGYERTTKKGHQGRES